MKKPHEELADSIERSVDGVDRARLAAREFRATGTLLWTRVCAQPSLGDAFVDASVE